MPIIKFTGRVLPDVMLITVTDHPAIDWYDADIQVQCSFKIAIQQGVIEIDCILDKYQDSDLARVYMRAFDLARATVDLTCFSTGYGLTVILDRYEPLRNHDTNRAPRCSACSTMHRVQHGASDDFGEECIPPGSYYRPDGLAAVPNSPAAYRSEYGAPRVLGQLCPCRRRHSTCAGDTRI